MSNSSNDNIIKTAVFKNVLRDLYNAQLKDKKAKVNRLHLYLGEIDDPQVDERKLVLDYLKEEKIIIKYNIKDVTKVVDITNDGTDFFDEIIAVEAICDVTAKVLVEYLHKLSFLSRFSVDIKDNREIVLNDKYILARPDYYSENHEVFQFVYQHPNKALKKEFIEKKLKIMLKKPLRQTIKDLRFEKELKKMFFPNVSMNAIEFRNNILQKDMDEAKINGKRLREQLKELKRWKKK